jgi:hypothetical protein
LPKITNIDQFSTIFSVVVSHTKTLSICRKPGKRLDGFLADPRSDRSRGRALVPSSARVGPLARRGRNATRVGSGPARAVAICRPLQKGGTHGGTHMCRPCSRGTRILRSRGLIRPAERRRQDACGARSHGALIRTAILCYSTASGRRRDLSKNLAHFRTRRGR